MSNQSHRTVDTQATVRVAHREALWPLAVRVVLRRFRLEQQVVLSATLALLVVFFARVARVFVHLTVACIVPVHPAVRVVFVVAGRAELLILVCGLRGWLLFNVAPPRRPALCGPLRGTSRIPRRLHTLCRELVRRRAPRGPSSGPFRRPRALRHSLDSADGSQPAAP
jgi:hypothetical protein